MYLAVTIYYWLEKVITKTNNMKCVAAKFRIHLTALWRCINGRIFEGGMAVQKQKTGTAPTNTIPMKVSKKKMSEKVATPFAKFTKLPSPSFHQYVHRSDTGTASSSHPQFPHR